MHGAPSLLKFVKCETTPTEFLTELHDEQDQKQGWDEIRLGESSGIRKGAPEEGIQDVGQDEYDRYGQEDDPIPPTQSELNASRQEPLQAFLAAIPRHENKRDEGRTDARKVSGWSGDPAKEGRLRYHATGHQNRRQPHEPAEQVGQREKGDDWAIEAHALVSN